MRNFKKILSLVLCMAMMLSVMVVGAGAAFKDQEKIVNTEAVDACAALNIINGYTDGSFKPEGTITRAEACKMICVALNGGKEPVLGTSATASFTDTKGHWAEGYIESCVAQGIVAGIGGGKFNPNGNVTGSQFAKMLLIALGYSADHEKFVGNAWEVNVNVVATQKDLYEDLETMDVSAALTRDNAAQMVWNALNAETVKYEFTLIGSDGNLSSQVVVKDTGETLLEDKYGADTFVGTFNGNDKVNPNLKDGYIQVAGVNNGRNVSATFEYDFDLSYIGEEVKVLYKDSKDGTDGQPDSKDTIYGVYVTGETDVLVATLNDVDNAKDKDKDIRVDGTDYDVADGAKVTVNYGAELQIDLDTTNLKKQTGDTIKFIFDAEDSDAIASAYLVKSALATVSAVNSEKVNLAGVASLKIADNDIYAGVAKDDVVVYTKLYSGNETMYIVEKAEVISGSVDSFKGAESVTVDGTVYDIHNAANMPASIGGDTATTAFDKDDIGETFDLYLLNGFVAAAVKTSESANNYSLVIDTHAGKGLGDKWDPSQIIVLDAEGKESTLTLDKDTTNKVFEKGDIVTWTGSADEADVTIESENVQAVNYVDKTKTVNDVVTTEDCVLFALTKTDEYKAYKLRGMDDIKGIPGEIVTNDDGKVVAVYVALGKVPAGASSDTIYGIVTENKGTVKIGDDYFTQYIVYADETTSYTVNAKTAFLTVGNLVYFDKAADDQYTAADVTIVDGKNADNEIAVWVDEYSEADGTLTYYTSVTKSDNIYAGVGKPTTLPLADDAVIVYVDADADEIAAVLGVTSFDTVTGYANAAIVVNDGEIDVIFVETSNECGIFE